MGCLARVRALYDWTPHVHGPGKDRGGTRRRPAWPRRGGAPIAPALPPEKSLSGRLIDSCTALGGPASCSARVAEVGVGAPWDSIPFGDGPPRWHRGTGPGTRFPSGDTPPATRHRPPDTWHTRQECFGTMFRLCRQAGEPDTPHSCHRAVAQEAASLLVARCTTLLLGYVHDLKLSGRCPLPRNQQVPPRACVPPAPVLTRDA